jgi:hypothetical protein
MTISGFALSKTNYGVTPPNLFDLIRLNIN